MLIWRGWGILVLVVAVIAFSIGHKLAQQVLGSPLYGGTHDTAMLIGMLLAAASVYGLHLLLERRNKSRTLVDPATGEQVVLKAKHDLFYIPVKYWSWIIVVLGFWLFFFIK